MTSTENVSGVLHIALGLVALWLLFFKFTREYREDALRDRLFGVRDKLFDFAASGKIAFDEPAYGRLRSTINSSIRFAHRITFSRLVFGIVYRITTRNECAAAFVRQWRVALDRLAPEQRAEMERLNTELAVTLVRHILTGSPLMMIFFALFAVWAFLTGTVRRIAEAFSDLSVLMPGLDLLEAQVVQSDQLERNRLDEEHVPA
jgi:hypothetical protein